METLPLEDMIIDDRDAGLFRVNRRAFTDPAILTAERERIFERCWIYAGHESEVPNPGDFRSRRVAGRPIILARGDDGQVRVLLNTCTHRGALVCREQTGSVRIMPGRSTTAASWLACPEKMPTVRRSIAASAAWRRLRESRAIEDSFSSVLILRLKP